MHLNDPAVTAICCLSQQDNPATKQPRVFSPWFAFNVLRTLNIGSHVLFLANLVEVDLKKNYIVERAGINRGSVDWVNNIVDNSRSRLWRKRRREGGRDTGGIP